MIGRVSSQGTASPLKPGPRCVRREVRLVSGTPGRTEFGAVGPLRPRLRWLTDIGSIGGCRGREAVTGGEGDRVRGGVVRPSPGAREHELPGLPTNSDLPAAASCADARPRAAARRATFDLPREAFDLDPEAPHHETPRNASVRGPGEVLGPPVLFRMAHRSARSSLFAVEMLVSGRGSDTATTGGPGSP